MNSYGLKRVRDAAEAAETDGRAIKRYSQALACAIAALEAAEAREAELRARVAELEGMVQKPFGPIKHRNACLVCGAIHGHGGLQCPTFQVIMSSAV